MGRKTAKERGGKSLCASSSIPTEAAEIKDR